MTRVEPGAKDAAERAARRVSGLAERGNRGAPDGYGPTGSTSLRLTKPAVAAGHAVAGGLELALWCDLRVVEEDAVPGCAPPVGSRSSRAAPSGCQG